MWSRDVTEECDVVEESDCVMWSRRVIVWCDVIEECDCLWVFLMK